MNVDPTPLFDDALAADPGIAEALADHEDSCGECPACAVEAALAVLANVSEYACHGEVASAICGDDREELFHLMAEASDSIAFLNEMIGYAQAALYLDEFYGE